MPVQEEVLKQAHTILRTNLPADRQVRVLEAGGGSATHIKLDRPAHVVALDISPEQLARNTYANETMLADLQEPLPSGDIFDLVVCFDVLEHLPEPRRALTNMAAVLAPGGLLVIGSPQLWSLKGLVTRLTPHGFHVFYYKVFRGKPDAGQPGHAPFPTFLRQEMALGQLNAQAAKLGLEPVYTTTYSGPALNDLKHSHPWAYALYALPVVLGKAVTLGAVDMGQSDYLAIYRRAA